MRIENLFKSLFSKMQTFLTTYLLLSRSAYLLLANLFSQPSHFPAERFLNPLEETQYQYFAKHPNSQLHTQTGLNQVERVYIFCTCRKNLSIGKINVIASTPFAVKIYKNLKKISRYDVAVFIFQKKEGLYRFIFFFSKKRIRVNWLLMQFGEKSQLSPSIKMMFTMSLPMCRFRSTCAKVKRKQGVITYAMIEFARNGAVKSLTGKKARCLYIYDIIKERKRQTRIALGCHAHQGMK